MKKYLAALALFSLSMASAARAQAPGPPPPPPSSTGAMPAAPPPAPTAATPAPPSAPPPTPPPYPYAHPYPGYAYPYPYPYPCPYPYPYPYAPPPTPPAQLPYNEGDPVPDGYHKDSKVRRGPLIAGTIMAGSTYLANVAIAGAVEERSDDGGRATWLYIPGVGTWAYVGDACDSNSDNGCSWVVLHSLTHTIGVALIVYAIAAPKTVLVRNDVGWTIAPAVTRSAGGLSLRARF